MTARKDPRNAGRHHVWSVCLTDGGIAGQRSGTANLRCLALADQRFEVRGPWLTARCTRTGRGEHTLFFFSLGLGWVGLEVVCFLRRCVMPWNDRRLLGELGGGGEGKRHIRDVNVCGETNREQYHHLRCLFGRTEWWWWCRGGMVVEVGVADAWTPPPLFFPPPRERRCSPPAGCIRPSVMRRELWTGIGGPGAGDSSRPSLLRNLDDGCSLRDGPGRGAAQNAVAEGGGSDAGSQRTSSCGLWRGCL